MHKEVLVDEAQWRNSAQKECRGDVLNVAQQCLRLRDDRYFRLSEA
jgi:hypothetical protein